ncbi:hypothetical protein HUJ05_007674 [Dendroctonus ponderosae]|nr:hypothetical protein HUJ05_007674 [Dendroctonus ponderosae]
MCQVIVEGRETLYRSTVISSLLDFTRLLVFYLFHVITGKKLKMDYEKEQPRLMRLWEEVDSDEAPIDKDSDQDEDVVESEDSDTVQEDDSSDDDRRTPAKIPRATFYLGKNNTTK